MKKYNLDLTGKKLGRVATEIAVLLMGKNDPNFAPNKVADFEVIVENASKMDISQKKLDTKIYDHYSGYPGGRKEVVMKALIAKKGYGEVLKNAVNGMLPKNKLRSILMKKLPMVPW